MQMFGPRMHLFQIAATETSQLVQCSQGEEGGETCRPPDEGDEAWAASRGADPNFIESQ